MANERLYDIVLIGATGYTGALTAEHIAEHLPTNVRWAIAGRSEDKLRKLDERLKLINSDRSPPSIEAVSLNQPELERLLGKAKVCISAVGPYIWHGEVVIEACITQRTHYLDTSGDIPWLKKMIDKHDENAKKQKVLLINSAGYFSATQDVLTWAVVSELNRQTAKKTREAIFAVCETFQDPSGGSLLSVIDGFASLDAKALKEMRQPWYLSPIKGREESNSTNLFGIRQHPDLGSLADSSVGADQNRTIVHRTWALLDGGKQYGTNFQYHEYMKAGTFDGIKARVGWAMLFLLFSISPIRMLIRRLIPPPGEGPNIERQKSSRMVMHAVAVADEETDHPKRAFGELTYTGGSYAITGAWLAQGAATLLYNPKLVESLGGGFITPAVLGQAFIEQAEKGGIHVETKMLQIT